MNVKTDTKEKFTVIVPQETSLAANMTEELAAMLLPYLQKDIPHIILNLRYIENTDEQMAEAIAGIQQQFYENNSSFVICEMNDAVKKIFEQLDLLDIINVTPTESEAWDILQMEEIERELLSGDE
jgi:anti-anti-sigma factor